MITVIGGVGEVWEWERVTGSACCLRSSAQYPLSLKGGLKAEVLLPPAGQARNAATCAQQNGNQGR